MFLWFAFLQGLVMLSCFCTNPLFICVTYEKCLFQSITNFLIKACVLLLRCRTSLYIPNITHLSDTLFSNCSPHPIGCLFISLFSLQFWSFLVCCPPVYLFLLFVVCVLCVTSKNTLLSIMSRTFSSRDFWISVFTFKGAPNLFWVDFSMWFETRGQFHSFAYGYTFFPRTIYWSDHAFPICLLFLVPLPKINSLYMGGSIFPLSSVSMHVIVSVALAFGHH